MTRTSSGLKVADPANKRELAGESVYQLHVGGPEGTLRISGKRQVVGVVDGRQPKGRSDDECIAMQRNRIMELNLRLQKVRKQIGGCGNAYRVATSRSLEKDIIDFHREKDRRYHRLGSGEHGSSQRPRLIREFLGNEPFDNHRGVNANNVVGERSETSSPIN